MNAQTLLKDARIVPVVVIDDVAHAVPLAETLLAEGLNFIEVTLRSEAALACIESIAKAYPDMILGAGSIRSIETFTQAHNAGAKFLVSPGFTQPLLDIAKTQQVALVPGAATAHEVMHLLNQGFALQKFFPAELLGGVDMLKALGDPLPEVRFFATGGINLQLAQRYLALKNVSCIGGSWLATADLIKNKHFDQIAARTKIALAAIESM